MTDRLWYRVWTHQDGERRIAGEIHYIVADSLSDAARQAEEEYPRLEVTSASILRRADGSWVREGDEDAKRRISSKSRF